MKEMQKGGVNIKREGTPLTCTPPYLSLSCFLAVRLNVCSFNCKLGKGHGRVR